MILLLLNLEYLEELFQKYLYHLLIKDLLKELEQIKRILENNKINEQT